MTPETRMQLMLAMPLVTTAATVLFARRPNLREASQLVLGMALFALTASLAGGVFHGARPQWQLWEFVPGFNLSLRLEPLGMLFALVATGLWVVTTAYATGYMVRPSRAASDAVLCLFRSGHFRHARCGIVGEPNNAVCVLRNPHVLDVSAGDAPGYGCGATRRANVSRDPGLHFGGVPAVGDRVDVDGGGNCRVS